MSFTEHDDKRLVRFGGVGACLPFLFVVRLICTELLSFAANVDSFVTHETGIRAKNQMLDFKIKVP